MSDLGMIEDRAIEAVTGFAAQHNIEVGVLFTTEGRWTACLYIHGDTLPDSHQLVESLHAAGGRDVSLVHILHADFNGDRGGKTGGGTVPWELEWTI